MPNYCILLYFIGPVSRTLIDFWRLMWQEKSPIIVMVTNIKEEKKIKCQQYWPDMDTSDYGPFRVTLNDEEILADYTIRKLHVMVRGKRGNTSYVYLITILICLVTGF